MCSRCGSNVVLRKGSTYEFYGCSVFPKCRNISSA
ncbi:topoisomerase DNA-binding C4 zinc finger domain-containing protein [Paenibacillus baekrokdamisoli]|nr:topoisomerase DNA-binding C4 zinc finger domain-containing protein [Paenibacillus baekrokdamisoli]